MSVRLAILSILEEGPAYGFLVRQEIDRRSLGLVSVNAGQIYTTLDRLLRDGFIEKIDTPGKKQQRYVTSSQGTEEVRSWLFVTDLSEITIEDLTVKLMLAASLPYVDEDEFFGGIIEAIIPEQDVSLRHRFVTEALSLTLSHKLQVVALAKVQLFGQNRDATPISQDYPRPGRPRLS